MNEEEAICRLHRTTPNNPIVRRVWPKEVTAAVRYEPLSHRFCFGGLDIFWLCGHHIEDSGCSDWGLSFVQRSVNTKGTLVFRALFIKGAVDSPFFKPVGVSRVTLTCSIMGIYSAGVCSCRWNFYVKRALLILQMTYECYTFAYKRARLALKDTVLWVHTIHTRLSTQRKLFFWHQDQWLFAQRSTDYSNINLIPFLTN